MSLDNIKNKILADAGARAEEKKKRAEEEARAIVEAAESEAERLAAKLRAEAEAEARVRREQVVTRARLEERKKLLAAKQEAMEAVFRGALKTASELPLERYRELFKGLLLASVASGDEVVFISEHDFSRIDGSLLEEVNRELARRGKGAALTLSPEPRPIAGGCILKGEAYEVNATLELLARRVREELEPEVVRVLFAQG